MGDRQLATEVEARHEIAQGYRFDAFLSYSHAADGRLAPALRNGLHRFAKSLFEMRALRVFRDKTARIWDVPPSKQKLINLARQRVHRSLTSDEHRRFLLSADETAKVGS